MDYSKRLEQLEYYITLLLEAARANGYPFYSLLIQKRVEKEEAERFLSFCEQLNKKYELQKAEGLLLYHPLLTEFASMLPPCLTLKDTIEAMTQQGLFRPLMLQFTELLRKK